MSAIHFKTKLFNIGSWTILHLPKDASKKLPSRGIVMVEGTINNSPFRAVIEPDGKGSHWLRVDNIMSKAVAGHTVTVEIEPTEEWIETKVPADLKSALATSPQAQSLWKKITPNAKWEWIRWIRATKQPETRARRIEVACSKLKAGMRRPCCFNRNACTEPYVVANNWVLMEPTETTKK